MENKLQFHNSIFGKGEFKLNPLRRHISVEMEVNRYQSLSSKDINATLRRWKDSVVRDGSIGDGGFEINTMPTNGDLFLKHISELCDGLAKIEAGCDNRCGLHVHINVKGNPLYNKDGSILKDKDGNQMFDTRFAYNHYDLRRLVLLYHKVEPALYALCHPTRLTGRYSQICGDFYLNKHATPKEFRKQITDKLYRNNNDGDGGFQESPRTIIRRNPETGERERIPVNPSDHRVLGQRLKEKKKHKYETVRYKSLNLHSYFMRGTVEFRHKEGTVDYSEVINWSLICGNLVEQSSKIGERDILALSSDPREALLAVIPAQQQDFCKAKWEKQEAEIPRFKQIIAQSWANRQPTVAPTL
jgi:hypothetical protein